MIKKKAILAGILSLVMTTAVSAQSVSITSLKYDGNTITVETQLADVKDSNVRIIISKDGEAETPENVYWISEKPANEQGKNTFVFTMPDEKNEEATTGTYKVSVRADGSEIATQLFEFVTTAERAAVIDAIGTMTVSDADEFALYFDEENENYGAMIVMGLPTDLFNSFSPADKKACAEEILKNKSASITEAELVEAVAASVGKTAMNNAQSITDAGDVLETVNPEYADTKYNSIESDELVEWIDKIMYNNKPYAASENYSKAYEMANVLYEFNNAKFNEIQNLLNTNKGIAGIDGTSYYTRYLALSADGKTAVADYVVSSLNSNPAETYEALQGVVSAAVTAVGEGTGSGSGSGGTGGGGGGGLGGSVSSGITSNNSVIQNIGSVSEPADKSVKYTDLASAEWARAAIQALSDAKIVSGTGDGKFEPMRYVTREEFVKMVVLAAEITDSNVEMAFDDVKSGDWYYEYVKRAVKANVITGESANVFGAGKTLTRQDMAVIVLRAANKEFAVSGDAMSFADAGDISDYAKESIEKLYAAGLINGFEDNTFKPGDYCTRAMAAQIIYNVFVK